MLVERLKTKFNTNEPIFTSEILKMCDGYSRAYVFRLIDKEEKEGGIIKFDKGIYYMPTKSIIGTSTITAEDVIRKRYVSNNGDIYGVYSGLKLQNIFSVTTQMPNLIEVVSNKESARCRRISLDGRRIVLRKSRCDINKNNAKAYTVLQLFSELDTGEEIDDWGRERIKKYMAINNVNSSDLFSLSVYFPKRTIKNLVDSGVLA